MRARAITLAAAGLLALSGLAAVAPPARAQAAITAVVNFAAGGATDIIARIMAPVLSDSLGAPIVVKNSAGAAGTIGAAEAARARPDGQTLLFSAMGPMVIQPHRMAGLSYRAQDFAPVCQAVSAPVVMLTPAASGLRTIAEVVERARATPGGLPYGSSGPGTVPHISMVAWARAAGVPMNHVPYRGAGEVLLAFQQGTVALFNGEPAYHRQHALTVLAAFTPERLAELPEVPTMRELGYDLSYAIWQGLFAPAALPPPLLARLDAACAAAMRDPAVLGALHRAGLPTSYRGGRDFAALIAADSERFRLLIDAAGLRHAE